MRKNEVKKIMPKKPQRPCSAPNCPKLTNNRFCEEHTKQESARYEKHERDPKKNKRYGRAWKQIRTAFLSANPLCEICKKRGWITPADTVHHKKKISDGGTNDWNNLSALCHECHSRIHAKQGDRW